MMNILKKIGFIALVLAVLFSVVFVGCKKSGSAQSSIAGGQTELTVLNYYDMTSASIVREEPEIWDVFKAANPDVKITREDLFNEPFHNKTEAYAAAGKIPDVVYAWPSGRSTTLHTQHLLKDLGPLVQKDGLSASYSQISLDPSGQGANYIAILPRAMTQSHAFYVNNEVLKDAGLTPAKTYSELKAQVPVLKAKGYETVIMPNQDTWVMQSCLFSAIAGRFGGAGWEEKILSGQAKFTDPDFVNALNFIKALYDDGVISRASVSMGYGEGPGQFATNKGAYYIDGDWRIGAFITDPSTGEALISPARQPNFMVTVFPDIEGAKLNKSTSGILGTGWGISADIPAGSAKEDAAWRLVKWLSGKEIQTFLLETGGISTPTRTDINTASLTLEPLQIAGTKLGNEYSTATVVIDGVFAGEVYEPINDGLQAIGIGSQTPQQVAQAAQKAFDTWKARQ